MREIKFRAWDNKKKEWLMGYEMPNLGGFSLFGECVLLGEWSGILDKFLFGRDGYSPDDLVVMQFTGLKDKNGKEIYEGDIVSGFIDTLHGHWAMTGSVFFDHSGFRLKVIDGDPNREARVNFFDFIGSDGSVFEGMKVIGNIYKNPELLKVATQSNA